MDVKYKKAIKAGIIVAIVMIIAALIIGPIIQYLVNTPEYIYYAVHDIEYGNDSLSLMPASAWIVLGLSAFLGLFNLLMYFCSGLLAARSTRELTGSVPDAAVLGAVAGATSVVILYPVSTVYNTVLGMIFGSAGSAIVTVATSIIFGLVCCFPLTIILAAIIGAIGAAIYKALRH